MLTNVLKISLLSCFLWGNMLQAQETTTTDYIKTVQILLPQHKKPITLKVAVIDGRAILEGDIVLGHIDSLLKREKEGFEKGTSINSHNFRWPNSTIPYLLDDNLLENQEIDIANAIAHVENLTNICLIPRTNEVDYVVFERSFEHCASSIGKIGGVQFIELTEACDFGSVVHEIGHTAGLYHEQARLDRDNFVTIHWDNIVGGMDNVNFQKYTTAQGTDIGAYDFGSIMHYGPYFFAINDDEPTISTHNGEFIGQRNNLSSGDIHAINTMYSSSCSSSSCEDMLTLTGEISGTHQALGHIITNDVTSVMPITPTVLKSEAYVHLQAGFSALADSDFHAYIADCSMNNQLFSHRFIDNTTTDIQHSIKQTSATLLKNYPNPFHQQTTIEYVLTETSKVSLQVFDIAGRLKATLIHDEILDAGLQQFVFDRNTLAAGIYIYQLRLDNHVMANKFIIY